MKISIILIFLTIIVLTSKSLDHKFLSKYHLTLARYHLALSKQNTLFSFNSIKKVVTSGANSVKNEVTGGVNTIKDGVTGGANTIKDGVTGGANTIKNGFNQLEGKSLALFGKVQAFLPKFKSILPKKQTFTQSQLNSAKTNYLNTFDKSQIPAEAICVLLYIIFLRWELIFLELLALQLFQIQKHYQLVLK
jgi:hypothetical protein